MLLMPLIGNLFSLIVGVLAIAVGLGAGLAYLAGLGYVIFRLGRWLVGLF